VDLSRYGWLARLVRRAERTLSRFAALVIANSVAGRDQALREGFANRNITVIGNSTRRCSVRVPNSAPRSGGPGACPSVRRSSVSRRGWIR
jgi:hypothetical protein